jgi:hypothetical protein
MLRPIPCPAPVTMAFLSTSLIFPPNEIKAILEFLKFKISKILTDGSTAVNLFVMDKEKARITKDGPGRPKGPPCRSIIFPGGFSLI